MRMNILKKINKMRIDRNWSIYKLSVESGIPQSTLTNMFNRETMPSIVSLNLICNAFGVTLSEFFSEENTEAEVSIDSFIKEFEHLSEDDKSIILELMRKLNSNN